MLISTVIRLCFLIAVTMLSGCKPDPAPATLTIGYTHEPPYSYIDEAGKVKGIYPDVARQVVQQMGIDKVKWVLLSFDKLIPALINNRIDVIAAGMAVTQSRIEQNLCFSMPLSQSDTAVLWRNDNQNYVPQTPIASQDLQFVVINGSSEESILQQHHQSGSLLSVEDIRLSLLALKSGRADLLVMTRPTLMKVLHETPERYQIKNGDGFLQNRQISAFVIKKQNTGLVARWNAAQSFISHQQHVKMALHQAGMSTVDTASDYDRCYTL